MRTGGRTLDFAHGPAAHSLDDGACGGQEVQRYEAVRGLAAGRPGRLGVRAVLARHGVPGGADLAARNVDERGVGHHRPGAVGGRVVRGGAGEAREAVGVSELGVEAHAGVTGGQVHGAAGVLGLWCAGSLRRGGVTWRSSEATREELSGGGDA